MLFGYLYFFFCGISFANFNTGVSVFSSLGVKLEWAEGFYWQYAFSLHGEWNHFYKIQVYVSN